MDAASGGLQREPDEAAPPTTRREARDRRDRKSRSEGSAARARAIPEWLKVGVVAIALMLLVRALLVQSFSVPSGSMQPTLEPGDRILVSRLQRGPSIQRGDVVVFDGTDTWGKPAGASAGGVRGVLATALSIISLSSGADYVKRVVGMPGDRIVCCDAGGRLTVNGVAVEEPYVYPGNPPSTTAFDVIVPAGKIWVMGDHRSASADSRSNLGRPGGGMIPLDDVVGRAWVRYWPLDRLGSLPPAPSLHDLPAHTGSTSP